MSGKEKAGVGSSFEVFLREEGIFEECDAEAKARVKRFFAFAEWVKGLTYISIVSRIENPTPAQKIRSAALKAADEAAPFIIPTGIPEISDRLQSNTDPEQCFVVLEAVEKRLALLEGHQAVAPGRMKVLRAMIRAGVSKHECIERIIAFYTERLP